MARNPPFFIHAVILSLRFFSTQLQSEQCFFCGGLRILILKIKDLENILKIIAKKFVYIIYIIYFCINKTDKK